MSKQTGHFVLYVKEDGSVVAGDICTSVSCAITSIHPEEGAKILGPFTVELDSAAKTTRDDMFKVTGASLEPNRTVWGVYHPVVESKKITEGSVENTTEGTNDNVVNLYSKVA